MMFRSSFILLLCGLMLVRPALAGIDNPKEPKTTTSSSSKGEKSPFESSFRRYMRVGTTHCWRALGSLAYPFKVVSNFIGGPATAGFAAIVVGTLTIVPISYWATFSASGSEKPSIEEAVKDGMYRIDNYPPMANAAGLAGGPQEVVAVINNELAQGRLDHRPKEIELLLDLALPEMTNSTQSRKPYQRSGYVAFTNIMRPHARRKDFDLLRKNVITSARSQRPIQEHRSMLIQMMINLANSSEEATEAGQAIRKNILEQHYMSYFLREVPFKEHDNPKVLLYSFIAGIYYTSHSVATGVPDPDVVNANPRLFQALESHITDREEFLKWVKRARR